MFFCTLNFPALYAFYILGQKKLWLALSKLRAQDKRFTYKVKIWRVRLTVLQQKNNNAFSVCVVVLFVVVELHVTIKYTRILSVTQQCFYVKFMPPATMQIICTSFCKEMIFQLTRTLYARYI
jgi:hypothetical protein